MLRIMLGYIFDAIGQNNIRNAFQMLACGLVCLRI